MDCSPLGSSVCGISQGKRLHWFAISLSGGFSQPRDQTHVSCIGRQIFYPWTTREAHRFSLVIYLNIISIVYICQSQPLNSFHHPPWSRTVFITVFSGKIRQGRVNSLGLAIWIIPRDVRAQELSPVIWHLVLGWFEAGGILVWWVRFIQGGGSGFVLWITENI